MINPTHPSAAIQTLAEAVRPERIILLGSDGRGKARADNDVDLLVRPLPGTSLLDLGGLLMDAQDLLGRRVDVVSERALDGALRTRILGEAVPLCEANSRVRSGDARWRRPSCDSRPAPIHRRPAPDPTAAIIPFANKEFLPCPTSSFPPAAPAC